MNRSYSKLRHIQESNRLLEERKLLNEVMDYDPQLSKSTTSSGGGIAKAASNLQLKALEDNTKALTNKSGVTDNSAITAKEALIKAGGEETKKFQDWMDTQGKWVASRDSSGKLQYTNLNKGSGYGKFGPSTAAAWKKYGGEYTTGKGTIFNQVTKGYPALSSLSSIYNTGMLGV